MKRLRLLFLFTFFALWSIFSVQAQTYYTSTNGWFFLVKSDGTAILTGAAMPDYDSHGNLTGGFSPDSRIISNLSIPSTVTAEFIVWDGSGQYVFTYGDTYIVTEIGVILLGPQRDALISVSIPNTVTTIDGNAFFNCNILQSAVISSSVTSIGDGAFSGCPSLTTISDLESVNSIGTNAFANCPQLKNVVFSESLTTIGGNAFLNDSSLVSVTIPESVTSANWSVFQNCTALQSATILNSTIPTYEFENCTALKDVTLSNNVTTIYGSAFGNCPSVETLTVPAPVTDIESGAFSGLTGLKTLNFYASNVPGDNFNGLPIENLDLTGVETISGSAFQNCTKLKDVVFSESLTTIGGSVFLNDSSLVSVTIPESVTSVNWSVFQNCAALQSATVLNSTIRTYEFANCTALKDVTLSNNVTTIEGAAFQNCTALTNFRVDWQMPLSVPSNVFPGVNTATATLYVPSGTKALYQAAPVWKDFGNIVEETLSVIPDETQPVGDDGKGNIEINLSIPSNATVTGSFEIQFPEDMTLDEELTVLSDALSSNFYLTFTYEENNTWLIEIKSNAMRSSTATEYQNIMTIAYTVDTNVQQGTYNATIKNLDFLLDDGTPIKDDLLTVPINVERVATSIQNIHNTSFHACFINNTLQIESSYTERITIYSVLGDRLYSVMKNAGVIEIPFTSLQGSVFLIKGSVSGTIKIIK